jgi:hypothetical protein
MRRLRNSVNLWTALVSFERHQGNTTKAKALHLQAMRACPWSKCTSTCYALTHIDLYTMASPENLMEKQMRVRVDMDVFNT